MKRQNTPFPNLCHFEFSDGGIRSRPAAVSNDAALTPTSTSSHRPSEQDLSSELAALLLREGRQPRAKSPL